MIENIAIPNAAIDNTAITATQENQNGTASNESIENEPEPEKESKPNEGIQRIPINKVVNMYSIELKIMKIRRTTSAYHNYFLKYNTF